MDSESEESVSGQNASPPKVYKYSKEELDEIVVKTMIKVSFLQSPQAFSALTDSSYRIANLMHVWINF